MSHNGTNGLNVPGPISRSSSVTLVSPVIKDGVEDIAHRLSEMYACRLRSANGRSLIMIFRDGIIGGIDDEGDTGVDNVSDAVSPYNDRAMCGGH